MSTPERRPTKEEVFARVAPTIAAAIKRNREEQARRERVETESVAS